MNSNTKQMEPVIGSEYIVEMGGHHISTFDTNNLGHISTKDVVLETAAETIYKFKSNKNYKIGLALGQVQSGKTTYFLTTASLAFDNGYDMVIVLAGTTNALLNQNIERCKDSYINHKGVYVHDQNLNTKNIYNVKKSLNNDEKVIANVLKNKKRLSDTLDVLNEISKYSTEYNILIIDDEGDYFTQNSKAYQDEESEIYKKVKDITNSSDNISFLSVTATPQNNIFRNINYELHPEFVVIVEPGEGYCGLDKYHKSDIFIELIDEFDKDLSQKNKNDLINAIYYYLLTVYEFMTNDRYKNEKYNWMLIHSSRLRKHHSELATFVSHYIKFHLRTFRDPNNSDDSHYIEIKEELFNIYKKHNINGTFTFKYEDFILDFNKVYDELKKSNFCKIVNSDKDITNEPIQNSKYGILTGGDIVGRGLTIKGLTVTFYQRDVKGKSSIDTTYQRARWFGYRENLLNLSKLFITQGIKEDFSNVLSHTESLISEIRSMNDNDIELKNHVLEVQMDPSMNPTGTIRNLEYYDSFGAKFEKQDTIPYTINDTKLEQINNKLQDILSNSQVSKLHFDSNFTMINNQAVNVSTLEFKELLTLMLDVTIKEETELKLIREIENLISSKNSIEVIFMKKEYKKNSGNAASLRKGDVDMVLLNNYLSNTTKKQKAAGGYKGDRYEYQDIDHIQIHYVRPYDKLDNKRLFGDKLIPVILCNKSKQNVSTIKKVI